MIIYYQQYLQICKEGKPKKYHHHLDGLYLKMFQKTLKQYASIKRIADGYYQLEDDFAFLRIINIEESQLEGADGIFLSAFCENLDRMLEFESRFKKPVSLKKKLVDILKIQFNSRVRLF